MTLAVTVTGTAAARAGAVLAWIAAGRHTKSQLRRVASAVGEGAATIPLVHRYLARAAAGREAPHRPALPPAIPASTRPGPGRRPGDLAYAR